MFRKESVPVDPSYAAGHTAAMQFYAKTIQLQNIYIEALEREIKTLREEVEQHRDGNTERRQDCSGDSGVF